MYRHILVPTDGSPVSREAAAAAIALARTVGARLTTLHVMATPEEPSLAGWAHGDLDFAAKFDRVRERRGVMFVEAVREAAMLAGVPCDCVVAHGPTPSGVILREARVRNCDMIVMASHGRRGSGGTAGSETLKVVALGGIPVLVHHASRAATLRPLQAA
jgi:nucleotide-binding universal stress UspA family protein